MQSTCLTGGLRLGVLGSAASLAIAAPLAVDPFNTAATTDASRIGLFFGRTPGSEKIGFVVMGVEAFNATATNVNFNVAVNFPAVAANTLLAGPTAGPAAAPTYRSLVAADLPNTTVTPGAYTNANITVDAQGRITLASNGAPGGVTGSGTVGKIPKWSAATALADSIVTDNGTGITIAGSLLISGFSYTVADGLEVNRGTAATNLFIGKSAGNATASDTANVGIGSNALKSLTSGYNNTAVGSQCMSNAAAANNNSAFGQRALQSAVTNSVSGNAAFGGEALFSLTTGVRNCALGEGAGYHLTNGQGNIFLGHYAGETSGVSPGTTVASNRMVVGGTGAASYITNVFIGNGEQNTAPVTVTLQPTSGYGTDIGGGSLNVAAGRGTGTGTGGAINFRTAKASTTSAVLNTLDTRLSVLQDGGIDWTGITTANAPAVSVANHGTIFYDSTLQKFRYSANGAAYADLVVAAATLTATYVGFGSAGNALIGSSKLTWNDANGTLTIAQGTVTDPWRALDITATWNDATEQFIPFRIAITDTASDYSSIFMLFQRSGDRYAIYADGGIYQNQSANGVSNPTRLYDCTAGAHTNIGNQEHIDVSLSLNRTLTWAGTANFVSQRAVLITAPTYAASTSLLIEQAATVSISGAPVPGANATITRSYALLIETGALSIGSVGYTNATLSFTNANSTGEVTIQAGDTLGDYTLTLPTAQGGASTVLSNDGAGVLSWAAVGNLSGTITPNVMPIADPILPGVLVDSNISLDPSYGMWVQNSMYIQGSDYGDCYPGDIALGAGILRVGNSASIGTNDDPSGPYLGIARFGSGAGDRYSTILCPRDAGWLNNTADTGFRVIVRDALDADKVFKVESNGKVVALQASVEQPTITAAATALAVTTEWNNAGVNFNALTVSVTNSASGIQSNLMTLGSSFYVRRYGAVIIQQDTVAATSINPALSVVGGNHTAYPAGQEINCAYFGGGDVQWATGAITTQRHVYVYRPTYTFVGASTITTAATFSIANAPVASTNATITRPLALWVEAGATSIEGLGVVSSTFSVSGNITRAMFYVTFTGSTASQTLTLPAASLYGAGRTQLLVIRNKSTVPVAIARSGSDDIDGGTSPINLPAGSSVWLMSDGVLSWDTN